MIVFVYLIVIGIIINFIVNMFKSSSQSIMPYQIINLKSNKIHSLYHHSSLHNILFE